MNTEAIFDEAALREITEAAGMAPLELIDLFLDDMTQTLAQLQLARQGLDAVTIGRLAHTLKSSAGNVGAVQIAAISRALEADCKREFDAEGQRICAELLTASKAFLALIERERPRLSAA